MACSIMAAYADPEYPVYAVRGAHDCGDRHCGGLPAGTVSAVCQVQSRADHRNSVFAAPVRACHVHGVCDDHHYPRFRSRQPHRTLFGLNIKLGLMYHANGISTINVYQGLVTRRLIEVLKKEGIGVSAWTVNEPSELEWFLQSGVTNITTRNLQKALALR